MPPIPREPHALQLRVRPEHLALALQQQSVAVGRKVARGDFEGLGGGGVVVGGGGGGFEHVEGCRARF